MGARDFPCVVRATCLILPQRRLSEDIDLIALHDRKELCAPDLDAALPRAPATRTDDQPSIRRSVI